jgi:c-di-GMP-related signal transduction protein
MNTYVARQPIFDRKQKVMGYELLYRSGTINRYDGTDGTEASLAVIRNTFLFLGQRIAAPAGKVFINLTRDLLVNGVAGMLPSGSAVIEIPEDTEPDETLIGVCQELKEKGYTLALDDYTIRNEMQHPLLDLADIVKVDFMQNSEEESRVLVERLANDHRKLLAEKVETVDEFTSALDMGYSYFQGYFFSKPVLLCYCCGGHGTGLEKSGIMLPSVSLITFPFASVLGA